MNERKVKRVLVMLDYGEEDPDSGEVFDITELVREAATKGNGGFSNADISLYVEANSDYNAPRDQRGQWPLKTTVKWAASINYNSSGRSGHLDDAINASMPDSFATQEIRKKLKRVQNRAEKLNHDIQVQRLMDASKIRYQHPIARVRESPIAQIPEVNAAS